MDEPRRKGTDLNLMHCNIISLLKNKHKIEELIMQAPNRYGIIGVSETKLKDINSLVNIDDYQFIQHDSATRKSGGVGIYIKNGVKFFERFDL